MGLKDRLGNIEKVIISSNKDRQASASDGNLSKKLDQYKVSIHEEVVDKIDLAGLGKLTDTKAREVVIDFVEQLIDEKQIPLNRLERLHLIKEIEDETFGLGPIEPLLKDHTVDEILVNGFDCIYIEKFGRLEKVSVQFRNEEHLRKIVDRIVSTIGRRIDEASPMVDARLKDGSRVNVIIPPLALNGTTVSIRKFKKDPLTEQDIINLGSATEEIMDFCRMCVMARLNLLISGGTGSGKTTLLNVLSAFIPHNERIITIEDAAELQLQQPHVVRLETRPENIEGKGKVTQTDLVRNSLRMRPDRIILGETRGSEALDMLQAMNTGHEGSLTTVHANTPRDALSRIETMVLMAGTEMPSKAINKQIASALDIIIQISRGTDGTRKIVSIAEITGMEGDVIAIQEIFKFEQTGILENGKITGRFRTTGVRPKCYDRFVAKGLVKNR